MDYIDSIRTSGVETTAKKIEYMASDYSNNRVFYSVIPRPLFCHEGQQPIQNSAVLTQNSFVL